MAYIRPYKETDFDACAKICIATLPPSLADAAQEVARLSPYLWTHPYTYLSPSTSHVLDDGAGAAVGYCIGCPDIHAFVGGYPAYVSRVLSRDVSAPAQLETREPWLIPIPVPVPDEDEDEKSKTTTTTTTTTTTVNPAALAQLAYRADWMLLGSDSDTNEDEDEDADRDEDGDGDGDGVEEKESGENNKKRQKKKKMGKRELTRRWRATMHIDLLEPWQGRGWGRKLIAAFVESVRASGADYGEGEHIGVAGENRKVLGFYGRLGFRVVRDDGGEGGITLVKDIERP